MAKKMDTLLIKDPIIQKLMKEHGELDWAPEVDLYQDIIESIISQQLSVKAAATISHRFKSLYGAKFPTPQQIVDTPDLDIRGRGISFSKIKYIKGVAQAILDGELDLEKLPTLSDEEVLVELVKLKGIGQWTAEMILIFTFRRPDVFSVGDLGLRTAVSKLYGIDRDDLEAIEKLSLTWSPYRSTVARYLWKSLDNAPKK